jgi:hypothetical protein
MHLQFLLAHLLHLVQLIIHLVEAAEVVDRGRCRGMGRLECLLIPLQRPLVHLHRLTQLAGVIVEAAQIVDRGQCLLLNTNLALFSSCLQQHPVG